jgi:HPt (histidine-containing phosphotransfer) domain-containing protein
MASDEEVAEWMGVGMASYGQACEAMEQADAGPQLIAQHAHRVKGSAGTLGLAAVHALARRIEAAAEEGQVPSELLAQLRPAIAATRAELERRGLLHEASTT